MSTTRICIEVELNENQPGARDEAWTVSLVHYSTAWKPRTWRDAPPADAAIGSAALAMSGVTRSVANCYLKTFNSLELKRPKYHWACATQLRSGRSDETP